MVVEVMYRKLKQIDDSAILKHRVWRGEREEEREEREREEDEEERRIKRRIKGKIMSSRWGSLGHSR